MATRSQLAELLQTTPALIRDVIRNKPRHYGYFEIPKANGDMRAIQPPKRRLKLLQRTVLDHLYRQLRIPTFLHGGLPRRSVVSHARPHVGKYMVATLDIRKFYPSTCESHILPVLEEAGFIDQARSDLLELVTLDGALAQGSPSSCLLANLGFVPTDHAIRKVCRRHQLTYTRFVDDIAISGDSDFRRLKGTFIQIIISSGYKVAAEKTHFCPQGTRQVVTGLVVNEKLRPTRAFITALKHDIHLCRHQGPAILADAEGTSVAKIKARLNGRVAHVVRCDPREGKKLRGLLNDIAWKQDHVTVEL